MSTIHQAASKLKGRKKKLRFQPRRRLFKSPQKKGLVEMCRIMTPRKPNSAKRKICKVNICKTVNKRRPYWILAKLRGITGFTNKWINVLVTGGRANDLPGVKYLMIKNKFGLGWKENIKRTSRLSKYGINQEIFLSYMTEEKVKVQSAAGEDDIFEFTEAEKKRIEARSSAKKK